jgi:hypothetical protein
MESIHGEFTVAPYIDQGRYYPNMSYDEVAACYNGMGAEWMGEQARDLLDLTFDIFRDATIIHDVDYCRGITEGDRLDADWRYLYNMRESIKHNVSWWHFRRRLRLRIAARII